VRRQRSAALGKEVPGWITGAIVVGALVSILWLERSRPLRCGREDKQRRDARNLMMGALAAIAVRVGEKPFTAPLARWVHASASGLLPRLNLPALAEVGLTVVLLDYTLYVWHVLTHRIPFLWRFHRTHHADLDLSTTTALRFHFVEMLLSTPVRIAQVVVIGAAPLSLSLWQMLTLLAILFHHSNVRLPLAIERRLCRIVVTPRMHGIHHSVIEYEANSNWGTIFSLPDYLHRTIRLDVPQREIDVGIPAFRDGDELRFRDVLLMPLRRQRPTWQLYGYGPSPVRRDPGPRKRTVLSG
jgi:sterol desaturase/sphingolipid hydroxylase (fatty acid hydroxylase superfamily)